MHLPPIKTRYMDSLGYQLSIVRGAFCFPISYPRSSRAYNVAEALTSRFPLDAEILASAVERAVPGHVMLDRVFRPARRR
jgi:hypothetical protein